MPFARASSRCGSYMRLEPGVPLWKSTGTPFGSPPSRTRSVRPSGVVTVCMRATLSVCVRLRGRDGEQLATELLDLVAQLRGVLEAQLLGGGEHLLLELDHEALELLARHPLDLLAAAAARRRDVRLLEREELRDVADALDDRLRRDAVLLVVRELLRATAVRLVERTFDRFRQLVGVHDHLAVDVARRAADRLHERGLAAQEALLVCV